MASGHVYSDPGHTINRFASLNGQAMVVTDDEQVLRVGSTEITR